MNLVGFLTQIINHMQIKPTWQSSTRHQQGRMRTLCTSLLVRMAELARDVAAIVLIGWRLTQLVCSFRSYVARTFARL